MSFFGGGFPFGDFGGAGDFFGGMGERGPSGPVDTDAYYELLGVKKSDTCDQILRTYRKAALKHHPDRGGDPDKFAQMTHAKDILTDPEKRKVYDKYGEEGINKGMGAEPQGHDIFDLLNGRQRGGGDPREKKCENVDFPLKVSLEDLYNGKTTKVAIQRDRVCQDCNGKGGSKVITCTECGGRGMVNRIRQMGPGMMVQQRGPCDACGGQGKIIDKKYQCKTCKTKGIIKERKVLEIQVDKGAPNKHRMNFHGESDERPGYAAGDLVVIIVEKEHETFKRKKADLAMTKTISLIEALTGFSFTLTHLDGSKHIIKSSPGEVIKPGDVRTVEELGMPIMQTPYKFGNLFIHLEVEFPRNIELGAGHKELLASCLPPPKEMDIEVDNFDGNHLHSTIEYNKGHITENTTRIHSDYADEEDEDDERMGGRRVVNCQQQLF